MKKQLLLVLTIASLVQPAKAFDFNRRTIALFTASLGLGGVMFYKYWRGTVATAEQARLDRLAEEATAEQARLNRLAQEATAAQAHQAQATPAAQHDDLSSEENVVVNVTIKNSQLPFASSQTNGHSSSTYSRTFEGITLAALRALLNKELATSIAASRNTYKITIERNNRTLTFSANGGRPLNKNNLDTMLMLVQSDFKQAPETFITTTENAIRSEFSQASGFMVTGANGKFHVHGTTDAIHLLPA